jgi:hypothetical protein
MPKPVTVQGAVDETSDTDPSKCDEYKMTGRLIALRFLMKDGLTSILQLKFEDRLLVISLPARVLTACGKIKLKSWRIFQYRKLVT